MFEVSVTVRLKEGVSDPEGKNTEKALHLLGFDSVKEVKTYRTFHMIIDENKKETVEKHVEQMCQRLLTNPVIHIYTVNIDKI